VRLGSRPTTEDCWRMGPLSGWRGFDMGAITMPPTLTKTLFQRVRLRPSRYW